MSVYRTKGERISMKKFKIKTNLVSGVIMGVAALLLIILLPSQVRVPTYDSGAPSPRIIPGICLAIISANHHKQEGKEDAKNYMVEGMCLGMCLGVVFSDSLGIGLGLGASLGMLIGETAGMFFKKK